SPAPANTEHEEAPAETSPESMQPAPEEHAEPVEHAEHGEHAEQTEQAERGERSERLERHDRGDRPARHERAEHAERRHHPEPQQQYKKPAISEAIDQVNRVIEELKHSLEE